MGRAKEEAPVDEVEAVRNHQRGASRVHHYPEKKARKPGWQQPVQYAFGDVENKADRATARVARTLYDQQKIPYRVRAGLVPALAMCIYRTTERIPDSCAVSLDSSGRR